MSPAEVAALEAIADGRPVTVEIRGGEMVLPSPQVECPSCRAVLRYGCTASRAYDVCDRCARLFPHLTTPQGPRREVAREDELSRIARFMRAGVRP
jgi:hypothetical protein